VTGVLRSAFRMLARVQTLLGVIPLGLYLAWHLVEHWPATVDRELWVDRAEPGLHAVGFLLLMLAAFGIHGVLGVLRLRREPDRAEDARGLRAVQAGTGILVVAFLCYHVPQMWSPGTGPHTSARDVYATLWESAGRPRDLAIYILGISAACFHFAHGLSRAAVTLRLAATPRGVLFWRLGAGVLGTGLWLAMLQLLAHFALGQGLF
jgi:succinate dehydrogenase / fumarate reductase, cytochrome b subunit